MTRVVDEIVDLANNVPFGNHQFDLLPFEHGSVENWLEQSPYHALVCGTPNDFFCVVDLRNKDTWEQLYGSLAEELPFVKQMIEA